MVNVTVMQVGPVIGREIRGDEEAVVIEDDHVGAERRSQNAGREHSAGARRR